MLELARKGGGKSAGNITVEHDEPWQRADRIATLHFLASADFS